MAHRMGLRTLATNKKRFKKTTTMKMLQKTKRKMRRKPKSPDRSYQYRSSLRGKTLQLGLTVISAKQIRDLKTLRLGYLHLGPSIEGLEQFTGLEHLYLNSNQIERIPTLAFASNRQLNFVVLSGNLIRQIEGLAELPNLQYIDLSKNLIEAVEPGICLP
jgi:Leucine-rich repeat (LRR) protein